MCGPAEADMFQARSWEEVSLATIMKCEREKSSPGSAPFSGDSQPVWGPQEEAFQIVRDECWSGSGAAADPGIGISQESGIWVPVLRVLRFQTRAGVVTPAPSEHPMEQPRLPNLRAASAQQDGDVPWKQPLKTLKWVIPSLAAPADSTCPAAPAGMLGEWDVVSIPWETSAAARHRGGCAGTAPAPCPRSSRTLQISQGSPAPPLHPCSILSSIYAPSSRPRCPGMALCLASQLQ